MIYQNRCLGFFSASKNYVLNEKTQKNYFFLVFSFRPKENLCKKRNPVLCAN